MLIERDKSFAIATDRDCLNKAGHASTLFDFKGHAIVFGLSIGGDAALSPADN